MSATKKGKVLKHKVDVDEEDEHFDGLNFESNEDQQYHRMLPNRKGQASNSYFLKSQKYRGSSKTLQKQEQNLSQDDQQIENQGSENQEYEQEQAGIQGFQEQSQNKQQEQQQQFNGLQTAVKHIRSQKQRRSRLLEQNINQIDEQDNKLLKKIKQDDSQYGNPQKLKSQINSFSKMVEIRVFSQKNLQQLKKYPFRNYQYDEECNQFMKLSEKSVIEGLGNLVYNYQRTVEEILGKGTMEGGIVSSLKNVVTADCSKCTVNVQNLWRSFSEASKQANQKLEQGLIQWSQKTVLLKNSTNRSHYNSLIMQTPVGQAKKAINDWDRVCKKVQLKRSPFRILLEGEENLSENSNPNIYDDLDLIQELQKIYEHNIEAEDKEFLISDTMRYIQNHTNNKQKKEIDRKASKNRKIRYNVHPKLLNFMPCQPQNLLEAHEQILKNLFNSGKQTDPLNTNNQEQQIQYIDL